MMKMKLKPETIISNNVYGADVMAQPFWVHANRTTGPKESTPNQHLKTLLTTPCYATVLVKIIIY